MSMPDELDELIAAGYGNWPQLLIPPNWRELPPPGKKSESQMEREVQLRLAKKERQERKEREAAERRKLYDSLHPRLLRRGKSKQQEIGKAAGA